MVDIHCHILPEVDDGPKSWETAEAMCRVAAEDELVQVAAVLSEFNAGVVQHSSFGGRRVKDIDWIARLGAASGRPVLWTGVTFNKDDPDMWRQQLAYLAPYFEQGLRLFGNSNIVPFANRFTLKNGQFLDGMPTWRSSVFG